MRLLLLPSQCQPRIALSYACLIRRPRMFDLEPRPHIRGIAAIHKAPFRFSSVLVFESVTRLATIVSFFSFFLASHFLLL